MHPAPSLIVFTTLSGFGFGLLVWLGLAPLLGLTALPAGLWIVALAACGAGLAASTFHLGHPERALLAFTQWRSSWLSREAWAAAVTLALAAALTLLHLAGTPPPAAAGLLLAALCLATVAATAMIYAQLRSVPRWHQPQTPLSFLALSLAGGATLAAPAALAIAALLAAGAALAWSWRAGDGRFAAAGSDAASATGLSGRGRVRPVLPAHSGRNYLLDEMVHRVGRRHALRLRALSLLGAALLPALLLLAAPDALPWRGLAAALHLAGAAASRWLFFAEAEHVVGLYYGRGAAGTG